MSAPAPVQGPLVVTEHCPAALKKRDNWSIDQFHILKKLGAGYASTVCLATCRATGMQVAVKMYHKHRLSQLNFFQIGREIRIHSGLEHHNILQLWAAFEDIHGVYLISEYASRGDVFSDVEKRGGKLTEQDAVRQIIYPFLCALQYLHGNNIIHRDIKPENLLLTATGVLKVADFGLSINLSEERPVTRVGTLDYMSPEVVVCPDKAHPNDNKELKHLWYTTTVDSWAVGVLAYELLVGKSPFDRGNKRATVNEILTGELAFPLNMSEVAQNFIRTALNRNPRQRPSVLELQEHPWVQQHLLTGGSQEKGVGRAVSVKDLSSLFAAGMREALVASNTAAAPDEVARLMQMQQNGRLLQSSASVSGADLLRVRDVRLPSSSASTFKHINPSDSLQPAMAKPEPRLGDGKSQAGNIKAEEAAGSLAGRRSSVVMFAVPGPNSMHEQLSRSPSVQSMDFRKQVSFLPSGSNSPRQSTFSAQPPASPSSRPSPVRSHTMSDLSAAQQSNKLVSKSATMATLPPAPSGGAPSAPSSSGAPSSPVLPRVKSACSTRFSNLLMSSSPCITVPDIQPAELAQLKSQASGPAMYDGASPKGLQGSLSSSANLLPAGAPLIPTPRHGAGLATFAAAPPGALVAGVPKTSQGGNVPDLNDQVYRQQASKALHQIHKSVPAGWAAPDSKPVQRTLTPPVLPRAP